MARLKRAMRYTKPNNDLFFGEWHQQNSKGVWYFFTDDELALMKEKAWTLAQILNDEHLEFA